MRKQQQSSTLDKDAWELSYLNEHKLLGPIRPGWRMSKHYIMPSLTPKAKILTQYSAYDILQHIFGTPTLNSKDH
jgi:hypothetical protein